jgi:hypothetical protein
MSFFKVIIGHVDPAAPEIDVDYVVDQRGLIDRFTRVLLLATRQACAPVTGYGRDEDHHYLKVKIIDVSGDAQQTLFGVETREPHLPEKAGRFFHREAHAILTRFLERAEIPIGEFVEVFDRHFLENVDVVMARILREMPARRVVIFDDDARYEVNGQRLGGLTELPSEIDIEASVVAAGRSMVRVDRIKPLSSPRGLKLPQSTSLAIPREIPRQTIDALYQHSHTRDRVRLKVRVRVPKTGGTAREVILVAYPGLLSR